MLVKEIENQHETLVVVQGLNNELTCRLEEINHTNDALVDKIERLENKLYQMDGESN